MTIVIGEVTDNGSNVPLMSPLERFLSGVYRKRHSQRLNQKEDGLTAVATAEPGAIHFR
jgi:hypothetical protein